MSESNDAPVTTFFESNDLIELGNNAVIKEGDININENIDSQDNILIDPEITKYSEQIAFKAEEYSTEEEDNDNVLVTISEWNDTTNKDKADQIPTIAAPQSNVKPSIRPAVIANPNLVNTNSNLSKPIINEENGTINNQPIYEYDIDKGEKPWKKPGSDISDYFNYGFNEDTWKCYCEKQRRLRMDAATMRRNIAESNLPSLHEKEQTKDTTTPVIPEVKPSSIPTPQFPIPPNLLTPNMAFPQLPPGFQLPNFAGMPLNIPPELANSIAGLAASRVGLQPNMLPNLSAFNQFLPPGMNHQALMAQFLSLQNTKNFVIPDSQPTNYSCSSEPVVIDDETIQKNDQNMDQVVKTESNEYKASKLHKERRPDEKDRHRESKRYRSRRSRSRSKSRTRSRSREYRDRKKRDR